MDNYVSRRPAASADKTFFVTENENAEQREKPTKLKNPDTSDLPFTITTISHSPRKSNVWTMFERIDKDSASCKSCKAKIKTLMGNTSGLRKHLSVHHPDLAASVKAADQAKAQKRKRVSEDESPMGSPIKQARLDFPPNVDKANKYASDNQTQVLAEKALLKFIATSAVAFNAVDNPFFHEFVSIHSFFVPIHMSPFYKFLLNILCCYV